MAHDPKRLRAILVEAVPPDLDLAFRPMFGGIMAYANGQPCAYLSVVGLAVKLAGDARAALLAVPGAAPLRYEPDQPPSRSYVLMPEAMLAQSLQLRPWLVRCAAGLPAERVRDPA